MSATMQVPTRMARSTADGGAQPMDASVHIANERETVVRRPTGGCKSEGHPYRSVEVECQLTYEFNSGELDCTELSLKQIFVTMLTSRDPTEFAGLLPSVGWQDCLICEMGQELMVLDMRY
eukprot:scaffold22560_cov135-Cylindrotheca_fusiformis.AAC.80